MQRSETEYRPASTHRRRSPAGRPRCSSSQARVIRSRLPILETIPYLVLGLIEPRRWRRLILNVILWNSVEITKQKKQGNDAHDDRGQADRPRKTVVKALRPAPQFDTSADNDTKSNTNEQLNADKRSTTDCRPEIGVAACVTSLFIAKPNS